MRNGDLSAQTTTQGSDERADHPTATALSDETPSDSFSIDPAAIPLIQKSSFFFFIIASFFVVSQAIILTLAPGNPRVHQYQPEAIALIAAFAFGFLFASLYERLLWLEPVLLLAYLPIHLTANISSMYSFAALVIAIIELYRIGYFRHAALAKITIIFAYYILSIVLVGAALEVFVVEIIMSISFALLFFVYLTPVFKSKWQITVLRPRQKIRWSELNLTERETDFLRDGLGGASFKEIAGQHHVSESTVRNTFAHIYHKCGVADRADLLSKFADFDIID